VLGGSQNPLPKILPYRAQSSRIGLGRIGGADAHKHRKPGNPLGHRWLSRIGRGGRSVAALTAGTPTLALHAPSCPRGARSVKQRANSVYVKTLLRSRWLHLVAICAETVGVPVHRPKCCFDAIARGASRSRVISALCNTRIRDGITGSFSILPSGDPSVGPITLSVAKKSFVPVRELHPGQRLVSARHGTADAHLRSD
jgi:hypothetical protein